MTQGSERGRCCLKVTSHLFPASFFSAASFKGTNAALCFLALIVPDSSCSTASRNFTYPMAPLMK